MPVLYENFASGTITDNPLGSGGTTINSSAFANLPVVASPDIMFLTLDPDAVDGAPEIVTVTAHTASATSVTVTRASQGTSARGHATATVWRHSFTKTDAELVATVVGDLADLEAEPIGFFETDTYTPSLTNIAIGTGGSAFNDAVYTYVGGSESGDAGIMSLSGRITLGTSGESVSGTPVVSLPSGFSLQVSLETTFQSLGLAHLRAGAANYVGYLAWQSSTELLVRAERRGGFTYIEPLVISSTVPDTWAAGDSITYNASLQVTRD
jgi:hypothetical protein